MIGSLNATPWCYLVFASSVIFAQQPDLPPTTAAGALIAGFSLLLATLVWIVKRQYDMNAKQQEAFSLALVTQQKLFSDALEKQNLVFAAVLDKVREDNQRTLKFLRDAG